MKYLTIVTFLLIIHVSAAIVNSAEYTAGYKFQPDEEAFKEIEQDVIKEQSYLQNVAIEDTSVSFGFGDFFRGIWIFVKTVWWGVVAVNGTIVAFGIDSQIATYISIIIYFIYGIALAQFISNRASKGMA